MVRLLFKSEIGPSTTEKETTTTTAMTRKLTLLFIFFGYMLDGFDDDANRVSGRCYSMCFE